MKKKSILAAGIAVLTIGILWTTCENANGAAGGTITGVTYIPEAAAFRIIFDNEIPGLTSEGIEAAPQNANLSWEKGVLSAPQTMDGGKTAYTLSLIFGNVTPGATFKDGEPEGTAKISVIKEGITRQYNSLVPVNLIKVNFESLTASPDYASGLPVQKFTLTFDKEVPGLSIDDILLDETEKTYLEDKGEVDGKRVYELGVSGKSEYSSGSIMIAPKKNGYRFTGGNGGSLSVPARFALAKVNGITLTASTRNIPLSALFPVTVDLTAAVDTTGDLSGEADWTLKNEPDGVTLTPGADGKTARLVVSEAIKTGAITVTAAAKAKPSKFNQVIITIEKNAGVVATDAEFLDALKSPAGYENIVIEGRITSPYIAAGGDEMSQWARHTIEVRDGGTLVIRDDCSLWINGLIKVRSGGKIEFRSGIVFNWYNSVVNPSFGLIFGDDEIILPASHILTTNDPTTGKPIPLALSFDGVSKTLMAGGVEGGSGAGFRFCGVLSMAGTGKVDIPEGYTLLVKDNIALDMEYNNGGFDFGPGTSAAPEAGLNGYIQAAGGDAVLKSTGTGLNLSSAAPAGSVLAYRSNLYCAAGKEVVFSGYPLTLKKTGSSGSEIDYELIPAGGVKISAGGVPGEVAAFAERSISRRNGVANLEQTVTLKIERTGGGRLSILVYPKRNLGNNEPKPLTIGSGLTEFDLGGTGGDWVGRIVLKPPAVILNGIVIPAAVEIGSAANSATLKADGAALVTGGAYHSNSAAAAVLRNNGETELYIDSEHYPF